ncbi:MAG: 30S ribosomal protein S17 [Candidatus Nanoarchaeia archaeon]|nr:30S ribosomal protein S17 [Candidatus Nanoarchaeia archaeon]MDD5053991.1 30S ribosomal protein S17 [Candidatus Nanoarchaeia archaeon]MDD5499785.1 30S ribosomal protein S17 [Candidatus Nanoarchaeia archaeon]
MAGKTGIKGISAPESKCNDVNCPFHGTLRLRGRIFKGVVKSDKMTKGVTVEFKRIYVIPKYERFASKKTRIKAHNPDCIKAKEGDTVTIMETRPISKTKSFVVIQKEVNNK